MCNSLGCTMDQGLILVSYDRWGLMIDFMIRLIIVMSYVICHLYNIVYHSVVYYVMVGYSKVNFSLV